MGAQKWLIQLEKTYRSSDDETFATRLAGWRGTADRVVLTFALLEELRALRRLVESLAVKGVSR